MGDSMLTVVNAHAYLGKYRSDPDTYYVLESGTREHALVNPLSASFMHRSRCADRASQILAVGDDEGRVHLLDTLTPPRTLGHGTRDS